MKENGIVEEEYGSGKKRCWVKNNLIERINTEYYIHRAHNYEDRFF
jgi:hypothetical protein